MELISRIKLLSYVFVISSAIVFGQGRSGDADILLQADIEGYVRDGGGIPIGGATVGILNGISTVSDASGHYLLSPDLTTAGYVNMYCWKDGYNYEYFPSVWAIPGSLTNQDMVLTIPTMYVTPAYHQYTLNPGEYFTTFTGIMNTGDGLLSWTADIIYNNTDGGSKDVFDCSPASVLGNPPTGYTLSYLSKENGTYQQYQHITGTTGKWNTISFWGTLEEVIPSAYVDFIIEIYASASIPGNLLETHSASTPAIPTSEFLNGYPVYYFEITIDEQTLTDCWIKIASTETSYSFFWLNAPFGTGDAQEWQGATQHGSHEPLAICLSNELEDWCTLDWYAGKNPGFGYIENIPLNFDASGKTPGETYTGEIIFTSHPDYGTFVLPVEMTVEGDPLVPVTNLEAVLIDDINGCFHISWDWTPDVTFEFFLVKRNGVAIGTSTTTDFIDCPPEPGTYCYTIHAYYNEGLSLPVTTCEVWPVPEIIVEPLIIRDTLFPGGTCQNDIIVSDTGTGHLYYYFPDFQVDAGPPCLHEVAMYDFYGDGWNGGYLSVFVDGVKVLDSITLPAGLGPEFAFFEAETGQEISTVFVCGDWCDECYYEINDGYYNTIATDGAGSLDPTGIPAGTCYASCPIYFITDASPNHVTVAPSQSSTSTISWNAFGYDPGTYYEDLVLESNDITDPVIIIQNIMDVLLPGYVQGTIISSDPPFEPLVGVKVNSSQSETRTLEDGSYLLAVPAKTFELTIEKPAYQTITFPLAATTGDTLMFNTDMQPNCYPVPWVVSTVNYPDEEFCLVEWSIPAGPEDIIYDDGEAEDYFAWPNAFSETAIKITPSGYPCILQGVSIYVGDGSFGSGWLGSQLAVLVYNEDAGGMPGELIDSVGITVNNYEWVEASGFTCSLSNGDLFISMMQLNPMPFTPPVGIDLTPPMQNRSYTRPAGGSWGVSSSQDFMIRVILDQPSTLLTEDYNTIYRVSDFDPVAGPETGTITPVAGHVTTFDWMDNAFETLPEGWYAYAVQTTYTNGCLSPYQYSNIVGREKANNVDIFVEDCLNNPLADCQVILKGNDFPFDSLIGITNSMGAKSFPIVWDGSYDIEVTKLDFETVIITELAILSDTTLVVNLEAELFPPTGLQIDSLRGIFSWEAPSTQLLYENFGYEIGWNVDWLMSSNGQGWFLTLNGSSVGFPILPGTSKYACVNDDQAGPGNDGSEDYMIKPGLNLQEDDEYYLTFDNYFTGWNGQMATVEYSHDHGTSWTVLHSMQAGTRWDTATIDLSPISGPSSMAPVWIAFHADDGGGEGSGWAIDNVRINSGIVGLFDSYDVYLDGTLVAQTDTTSYQFSGLVLGQNYTACVTTSNSCGSSDLACIEFTYLNPPEPDWLEGDTANMNAELSWYMDTTGISNALLGYFIYRDSILLDAVAYTGGDTSWYIDVLPDPMCYDYQVSALFVHPVSGDTLESDLTPPEEVCLIFGTTLPYFQDWTSGTFDPDWTAGDNWVVNSQFGNPEPSAEFTWVPILTQYEECLVSGPINGIYPETKDDPYTDGQFMLKFDLQLDNVNATGNEYFRAEVWSEGVWYTIKELDNSNGSFIWETFEADITEYAMGHVFKLRFMSAGEESSNILSWFVDNIEVYHYCAAPDYLSWEPVGLDTCFMKWEIPLQVRELKPFAKLNQFTGHRDSKELLGYNIYSYYNFGSYSLLDFTTDTFYAYRLPEYGYYEFYVTALYESCESGGTNEIWVEYYPIGLIDFRSDRAINVYPNPTSSLLYIESTAKMKTIAIMDLRGSVLHIRDIKKQKQFTIDVHSMQSGIYLVRIETEAGSAVRKVVIE